jgi:hypothetical protein
VRGKDAARRFLAIVGKMDPSDEEMFLRQQERPRPVGS